MGGLRAYLDTKATEPFSWAANNCLGFVSGALVAQGKPALPLDWTTGYRTARGAAIHYARCLMAWGVDDIADALDEMYTRVHTLRPTDGMIAARPDKSVMGHIFGVAFAGDVLFLSEAGIQRDMVQAGDLFWL